MNERKRRFSPFLGPLERVDSFFLGRYQGESLAVWANLRILLAVLLLGALALLVTGPVTLLNNSNPVVRALVVGVMVFFPLLLWLLRTGRRTLVVVLFTVVVSLLATVPYLVDAGQGFNVWKIDRMGFQILLQLILISAITEKASYLVLGFVILVGALSTQALAFLWPLAGGASGFLLTVYGRDLVNLTLATGVLLILQQSFHRAIGQVEAANRTLDAKVQERTEQLQLAQRSLVEGERLAVLGRLSASVAHEINTPLGAISSSIQTMRSVLPEVLGRVVPLFRGLPPDQEAVLAAILGLRLEEPRSHGLEGRRLQKAMAAQLSAWGSASPTEVAEHLVDAGISGLSEAWAPLLTGPKGVEAARFISDFSSVSRSSQIIDKATQKATHYIVALRQYYDQKALLPMVPVDVGKSLDEVLTLLQGRLGPGIRVEKRLEPGLEAVGQPGRLIQVWDNLVKNALDAMGPEGVLTLASRQTGYEVEVSVSDTGPGIPEDLKGRLFEPFLTTKSPGVGTGIGLGIARAIIEEHDGNLTFESEPGKTRFTVRLPRAPGAGSLAKGDSAIR